MPRTHLHPETRGKFERANLMRRMAKRTHIDKHIDELVALVNKNKFVREVSVNKRRGCISFHYNGRHVQYWLGTFTLIVRNPVAYTQYKDFLISEFKRELEVPDPNNAFTIKEA